ncbi:hypothetical protein CLAFUW4_08637 [Fulvia fulva]|uniref:uncharacterized protein n=1 Tax=Passalora fulva TaxID=5499 RepID=UPI0028527095|nr:uncharacterized protein CLAFUR5_20264 [Fulvia fulva]KAK4629702.1 hypothetical protein CLAFUR4_08639 [Fulvia fulva]KAK4630515.1 hypothetical protein CLAFUR0_08635 [Fulvia fulva]WMI38841.1 hypothetical protein CLAFUR5_20264 [Fulvia fulva]WPV12515.1 hypothetical protein CLAFUW4_08637 [Fulvia fulva]WPV27629.1 hypothetical protein CLAFUW7_08634 [Fulvia fulva]
MKQKLGGDTELAKKLMPDFPVGCRRITPGDGYLEALTADNVTARFDPIVRFTEGGILRQPPADTAPEETQFDLFTGPNSPLGHGSLFGALEASANYTLKRCSKMASEGIKSVTVKPDVLREFNDYSQAFLQQLCIHRVADRGTRTTRSMAV